MLIFKSRKKSALAEIETEELRNSVSEQYASYNYVTTTNKENVETLQQVEEDPQELPYLDLNFKEENIVQVMVYSEIFGKPKSKRRKR